MDLERKGEWEGELWGEWVGCRWCELPVFLGIILESALIVRIRFWL